jgi:iron(III) transport system ATP-binding protein
MAMSDTPKGLVVEGVRHAYGKHVVVDGVSLAVAPAEILCLLGPSGCGKTTTLRIIAGLEEMQEGRIAIDGSVVANGRVGVPPERRRVSLLFQDFALFPHLTVLENVAFGLSDLAPKDRATRAREVLGQVDMLDYASAYPHVLSGGQQQRIALARARAPRPRVMLLDEPFSNLDARLRVQLRDLVLHVLKNSTASTLLVTHDSEEAMFLGDRIAVMREGRIVQIGRPETLYTNPVDPFVASLFGEVNRIDGIVGAGHVATPLGRLCTPGLADGTRVEVMIRPEAISLVDPGGDHPAATVVAARMLGSSCLVHLSLASAAGPLHLHARTASLARPRERDAVGVRFDPDQVFVFPVRDGG